MRDVTRRDIALGSLIAYCRDVIRFVRSVPVVVAGLVVAAACGNLNPVNVTKSTTNSSPSASSTSDTPSSDDTMSTDAASTESAPTSLAPITTDDSSLDDGSATAGSTIPAYTTDTIQWEPLAAEGGVELATLEVPVDYDDPSGAQFELALVRRPADDQANKIGSLLVNPGGPGFGGSFLVLAAEAIYDKPLLDRFDIVGWDPRGTGESTPAIDCIDDYDYYFAEIDATPDDEAEEQHLIDLAQEFADNCVSKNADILGAVGTNNSARDMNAIREALGEEKISYFGFSYGSELGATWATLFPDTVRAAVLDGAADPTADSFTSSLQQLKGFEASVETFLDRCDETENCTFDDSGNARAAFEKLLADLDANPVPAGDGRPPVNRDVALNAVIQAMYDEGFWPDLDQALADAQEGDGSGLLELHDLYFQRLGDGEWGNELEAFQVISCNDTTDRPTVDEVAKDNEEYRKAAPLLVPEGASGGYFCTFLPPPPDPRVDITGAGAGPIVVVGTTGDPATPLESSRKMAETLEDGRFIIVEADQHTAYGVNSCINNLINDYLVDLKVPDNDTEC